MNCHEAVSNSIPYSLSMRVSRQNTPTIVMKPMSHLLTYKLTLEDGDRIQAELPVIYMTTVHGESYFVHVCDDDIDERRDCFTGDMPASVRFTQASLDARASAAAIISRRVQERVADISSQVVDACKGLIYDQKQKAGSDAGECPSSHGDGDQPQQGAETHQVQQLQTGVDGAAPAVE